MRGDAKQELELFQCEHIRLNEEFFARTLSESDGVRLFFINEGEAFTDGKNIIVDPAVHDLYADDVALKNTMHFLKWPANAITSAWDALHFITRAQTIHECLHILYTDFPLRHLSDPKCDTRVKRIIMSLITNIIEDAYIEAVGASVYDNMGEYLKFGRVSQLFSHKKEEGTAKRALKDVLKNKSALVNQSTNTGKKKRCREAD